MDDSTMVVALCGMVCGTGLTLFFIKAVRDAIVGRGNRRQQDELLLEIRSLRAEIGQVRQQNNDLILGFDGAVQGLERRVGSLESRPAQTAPREQTLGAGRG